jgi:20S proteasome subunit alpha 7
MSSIGTGYDLSVTTYSPDGRLYQVEYAYKAVDLSGTCIGIQCKDGVVLGVENLIENKMTEEGTNRRIYTVDKHSGMVSFFKFIFQRLLQVINQIVDRL